MTDEELLLWLVVVLMIIELFAFFSSLRRKTREQYEKIFEDWVKGGNLLFKVKGSGYIYCKKYYEKISVIARFLVFDNEGGCYEYEFYEDVIGKAIFKNRLPEEYIRRYTLTKGGFVERLIDADSENKIHGSFSYPFSFDKIDLNELPDWLVAALVERKLSE